MAQSLPGYAILVDRQRRVRWVNRIHPSHNWEDVLQSTVDDYSIGRPDAAAAAIESCFLTGQPQRYLAHYGLQEDDERFSEAQALPVAGRDDLVLLLVNDREAAAHVVDRTDRLQEAQEAAGVGYGEFDVVTRSMWWSSSLKRVFGLDVDDDVDMERYFALIVDEDRDRVRDEMHRQAQQEQWHVGYGIRHPNGRRRQVVTFLRQDKDASRSTVLGVTVDVTELREAEGSLRADLATKELLLHELAHRVKNNLQQVLSLVRLYAQRSDDEHVVSVLQEFERHLMAMSMVHSNLLPAAQGERVGLRSYIQELAGRAQQSLPRLGVVDVMGDDIDLDIDAAMLCGLALNELLTNCAKHGADDRAVLVQVRLLREDGRLAIDVVDDGKGFPPSFALRDPVPQRRSLGLVLVRALMDQIRGDLLLPPQPDTGAQVRLWVNLTDP